MTFCTLFDSNYIAKGLAMYSSLKKCAPDSRLFILAMDNRCMEILESFSLDGVTVVSVNGINDTELAKARQNRSRAEFCWTCGAYCTYYFMTEYNLKEITYLDSDLMFFSSPSIVEDEIRRSGASVGLAPHFMKRTPFGRYCVQYVYFKNDERGSAALKWWRDRCLEWCYCKLEDGKYADQKYLETIMACFPGVHEIRNRGVGVAYWNSQYYRYSSDYVCHDKEKWPLVFFHFSGINIKIEDGHLLFMLSEYFSKKTEHHFFEPYYRILRDVYSRYLGIAIEGYVTRPISPMKYMLKKISYPLHRIGIVDDLFFAIIRLKYREHRTPYNEKM